MDGDKERGTLSNGDRIAFTMRLLEPGCLLGQWLQKLNQPEASSFNGKRRHAHRHISAIYATQEQLGLAVPRLPQIPLHQLEAAHGPVPAQRATLGDVIAVQDNSRYRLIFLCVNFDDFR
jgi:hypothetical protein